MSADLQGRKAAKDLITATLPAVPVVWAGADQPTAGEYIVVGIVPGVNVGTMKGYAFTRVRLQVDVWHLSVSDSTVGAHGGQLVLTFSDAGWDVPTNYICPPEGQKDAQGRVWQRYTFDVIREFSHA